MPHRTARGRFDEIALEVVIGTLADDLGQRPQSLGEDAWFGIQIIWELCSNRPRFGWAAKQDCLSRLFDSLLCDVEVLKPRDDRLRCRCERLCGEIATPDRFLERFERRLNLGTRKLGPLLLEAPLEVLLRAQRKGQATLAFSTLLVERVQCGSIFLRGLPRALGFLL